jgi:tagatose 1,6-diphosphate aldolase
MTKMTTAALRGYQQICGRNGAIMVNACDQRAGIRKLLAKGHEDQKTISDAILGDTKADVVRYLAAEAPSVLLEPICAVPRVVEAASLARDVALLIGRAIPRLREIQAILAYYPRRLRQIA